MDTQTAVKAENITKKFGGFSAVDNVSFSVNPGDIYALIGENGAGKTTIIRMMTGLYLPDSGSIELFGHDITGNPEEAKRTFGYVPDNPAVYNHLTGREFFYLAGNLRGMSETQIKKKTDELVGPFALGKIIDSTMNDLSRGNRQKIAFIASLLSGPRLVIIDEPIVGLDPDSIDIFGGMLKKFSTAGGTVFFSTHILSFAEKYATRAGIIHEGILKKEINMEKGTDLNKLYHRFV